MPATFIGIDLGTSGCRACLIDADNSILAEENTPLPEPVVNKTHVEQDANLWWQAVKSVLSQLCQMPQAKNLQAISVDGTSSTLLCTNADYQPLAPALMYNDTRAIDESEVVSKIAPKSAAAVYGASSSLSKLLWLIKKYPQTQHALHQADFIIGNLSGNYSSDFNNCLKLGFDPITESWPDWIQQFDFPQSVLPVVNPPGTSAGQLTESLKAELGLQQDVLIINGTTDSIAGFLATGASETGDAVISIGSTMAIKVLSEQPVNSYQQGIYSHKINGQWLVGGASNAGTTVLRTLFSNNELQQLTESLDFDKPTRLNYYPIPKTGERFPVCDHELKPVLTPRPESNRIFLQAILESLTRIEQQCYSTLEELGVTSIKRLFTLGGAVKNKKWMQYRERTFGISMHTPLHLEACFGTALLAKQGYDQIRKHSESFQ